MALTGVVFVCGQLVCGTARLGSGQLQLTEVALPGPLLQQFPAHLAGGRLRSDMETEVKQWPSGPAAPAVPGAPGGRETEVRHGD